MRPRNGVTAHGGRYVPGRIGSKVEQVRPMWGPEAAGADVSQAGSEQVGAGEAQADSLGAGSYAVTVVRCYLTPKDTLHVLSPHCPIWVSGVPLRSSSRLMG